MKKSDIVPGQVYAYRRGTYASYSAVIVLDNDTLYQAAYRGYGSDGGPLWETARRQNQTSSRDVGLLAVVFQGSVFTQDADVNLWAAGPASQVTLEQVLAMQWRRDRAEKRAVDDSIDGLTIHIVSPRYVAGLWSEVKGAERQAKEERRAREDLALRESRKRVARAQQRVDALRALGLPGLIPDASEHLYSSASTTYSGNTRTVQLTLDQVDALLSLIPAGPHFTQSEETQ